MAVTCGAKCARIILIIFNFFFWLSGAALLAVGIWIRLDPDLTTYVKLLSVIQDQNSLYMVAYVLIGVGAFVFLVGFLGCCGAIKESQCMLGLYIFFLVIVMAAEIAAGVLAIIYRNQVEEEVESTWQEMIKKDYNRTNQEVFSLALDVIQVELKCCGATNFADYQNSYYTNSTEDSHVVPLSCCVLNKAPDDIEETLKANGLDIEDADECQTGNIDYINNVGCYDSVLDWFEDRIIIFIGVGIGIAVLELFGIIFAVCLCRNVGEEK